MRVVLAAIWVNLLLSRAGLAQCPTYQEFTNEYRQILRRPFAEQYEPLLAWRTRWQQCNRQPDSIFVGALLQIGQEYHAQNKLTDAVGVVQQAVQICRSHPKTTRMADLAKGWYRLGVICTYQNRMQPAMDALKRAIATGATDRQADVWVSNAHLYLAYAYVTSEDYQQVLTHADAGISIARRLANEPLLANLFRQKAHALRTLERYDEAQLAITQAIDKVKGQAGLEQALADDYSVLSLILGYKNQYRDALHYAKLSYDIARQAQHSETPNLAIRLGYLYNKIHDYQNAIQYCRYGIDHATDSFSKATGYNILGTTFWQQKQFSKALACYQQGLRTLPIGFTDQSVRANPKEEQLRLMPHKGVLLTLIQEKADTWLDYAKATNNHQRLQYALDSYEVADRMIDYMRWEHVGQQSKLFWREKTRGVYERAIETCWRLNDTQQAFRFIEKSRAVMLADKLNELGAQRQLTPAQVAQEQRLRQGMAEQQNKLAGLSSGSLYDSLRTKLFAQQDSLDTFLRDLEQTNPAYYRYKYDNTVSTLADLKTYLTGRNAQFVSYFVGDSALYILAASGRRDTLIRQPVGTYAQTVRAFMGLLADPDAMNQRTNVTRFIQLGNMLYRQLLAPLNLTNGGLIVSSDGAFVPFEALSRSAGRPEYLVRTNAISYAYSVRLLLKKEAGAQSLTGFRMADFLGIAPVSFASRLDQVSLPGSDDALRPIADRFGSSVLLTHERAKRRTFLTEAVHARVVHLFTHALADDSTGQEPKLYFADSTLKLSELGDAGLPHTQLVVLAACKTGVGTNQRGEGVFSLARGFAALGVPSVLTTLWSVENRATYEITNQFYRYIADGLSKDEALQRAQIDWLDQAEGAGELPNYWAGLIIVGDAEPLDAPRRWPWIAGSALLVVAGIGLWWRRKWRVTGTIASRQIA